MNLTEKLSDYAHRAWSNWMKYVFLNCNLHFVGGIPILIMDSSKEERWKRQIETPYEQLSEEEKESDRIQAREISKIFKQYIKEKINVLDEDLNSILYYKSRLPLVTQDEKISYAIKVLQELMNDVGREENNG